MYCSSHSWTSFPSLNLYFFDMRASPFPSHPAHDEDRQVSLEVCRRCVGGVRLDCCRRGHRCSDLFSKPSDFEIIRRDQRVDVARTNGDVICEPVVTLSVVFDDLDPIQSRGELLAQV